ncbi:MAG: ABC transporter substrate-binding protein, partial [Actinomycetota bacterium]
SEGAGPRRGKAGERMPDRELSLAIADYDRVEPLADGSIAPEGVTLKLVHLAPSETFYRMLKFGEFDVSEMSLSSYLIARDRGTDLTAIPLFPFRSFFHTSVYCSRAAAISAPQDLEGKRFGLTEYQVTAAVWTRGVLQHHFGIDLRKVRWFVERTPDMSHGGITDFTPPEGISIEQIDPGDDLQSLLEESELDAILPSPYPGMASRLNRTDEDVLRSSPSVARLFPDPKAEALRYLDAAGAPQMNHTIVIKESVLREAPGLAPALYEAFGEAKALAYRRLESLRRSSLVFGPLYLQEQKEIFGDDPYPYGLEANRQTLETLIGYSHEQGLISTRPSAESLFVPELLST